MNQLGGYRLKTYGVTCGAPGQGSPVGPWQDEVRPLLPQPAETIARPGVGVVILHAGAGCDYIVLAWWDRENELPLRLRVREGGGAWRDAGPSQSVCVWDLDILAHERAAYVRHVLEPARADIDGYLADAGRWSEVG